MTQPGKKNRELTVTLLLVCMVRKTTNDYCHSLLSLSLYLSQKKKSEGIETRPDGAQRLSCGSTPTTCPHWRLLVPGGVLFTSYTLFCFCYFFLHVPYSNRPYTVLFSTIYMYIYQTPTAHTLFFVTIFLYIQYSNRPSPSMSTRAWKYFVCEFSFIWYLFCAAILEP